MKRAEVLETLELLASDQWGIITTAQAQREGISRLNLSRLADQGVIRRARRGVYLLPSHAESSSSDIQAAWLSLEPQLFADERWEAENPCVVSHQSAAQIHRIGRLIPLKHTFSIAGQKRATQTDVEILDERPLAPDDVVSIGGLPVTSIERTIGDLAEAQIERQYLAELVADGLILGGNRFTEMAAKLEPFARNYQANSGADLVKQLNSEAATTDFRRKLLEQLRDLMELADAAELLAADDSADAETFKSRAEALLNDLNEVLGGRKDIGDIGTPSEEEAHLERR